MYKTAIQAKQRHDRHEVDDELISFAKLTRRLRGKIHVSALHRWATRGRHGIILDSVTIERQRRSSVGAVRRFLREVEARN